MLRLGPAPAVVERERCAVQPRQHPFAFRLPSCTVAAQDIPAIREGRAWAACTSTPPRVARSAGCQAVLRSMSSRALPARRVRDAEAPLRRCRSPVPSAFDVRTAPGCPPVISPRMIRFPGSKPSTAAIGKTVGRKYCQAQARCRPRSWTRETDEKHSRNGVTPTGVDPVPWTPNPVAGGGIRDVENRTAVPGGVPPADGRAGSIRTNAGGLGSGVRALGPRRRVSIAFPAPPSVTCPT